MEKYVLVVETQMMFDIIEDVLTERCGYKWRGYENNCQGFSPPEVNREVRELTTRRRPFLMMSPNPNIIDMLSYDKIDIIKRNKSYRIIKPDVGLRSIMKIPYGDIGDFRRKVEEYFEYLYRHQNESRESGKFFLEMGRDSGKTRTILKDVQDWGGNHDDPKKSIEAFLHNYPPMAGSGKSFHIGFDPANLGMEMSSEQITSKMKTFEEQKELIKSIAKKTVKKKIPALDGVFEFKIIESKNPYELDNNAATIKEFRRTTEPVSLHNDSEQSDTAERYDKHVPKAIKVYDEASMLF